MIVFYHGDMDGIASANILLNKIVKPSTLSVDLKKFKEPKDFIVEFDYNKQDELENVDFNGNSIIYFVDCCPDKEILDYFIRMTKRVIVFDHHKSRQEMLEAYLEDGKIDGMFYNGASATLITYCYVTLVLEKGLSVQEARDMLDWYSLSKMNQEDAGIPLAIRLVNSWDIWNNFYADAEPYKIVFESKHFFPLDKEIKDFLYDDRIVTQAIRKGHIMLEQMNSWAETFMSRYGYEVEFEGHKFFVANLGNANSKYFGDKIKDYDAVIPYCYNGDLWTCSIYSDASKNFDCAEFAVRFGGGGHKKAAGFRMKELPQWLSQKI